VTGSYSRTRSARVAITMATLASASAAHSNGGFILVDDTNQPGVYRVDIPDAAFATGAAEVVCTFKATGCRTVSRSINLVNINNQVAYVPNAAADAAGGLPISDAGGLDLDSIQTAVVTTIPASLLIVSDGVGYLTSALLGTISDAGTAGETYVVTFGGSTYTLDYTGLDATGNRTGVTRTKT